MREIKFRAWDEFEKIMMYPENGDTYVESNDNGISINHVPMINDYISPCVIDAKSVHRRDDDWWHNNYVLMQYTGLKDKHGVEIYEGDVILDADSHGRPWRRLVEWSATGFNPFSDTDVNGDPLTYGEDIEVIGNIYENPELLR